MYEMESPEYHLNMVDFMQNNYIFPVQIIQY